MNKYHYTVNAHGYMLYKNNKAIGGAGTLNTLKKYHWKIRDANIKMYRKQAEQEIQKLEGRC